MNISEIAQSTLTCPQCGTSKIETMPTDACQFFYDCTGCGTVLRPKPGDCCVFCSYGTVPCPPIQQGGAKACCTEPSGQKFTQSVRPALPLGGDRTT